MEKPGSFQFLCRAAMVQDLGLQHACGTVPPPSRSPGFSYNRERVRPPCAVSIKRSDKVLLSFERSARVETDFSFTFDAL